MGGAIAMTAVLVVIVGVTAYLIGTMIRSIQEEKHTTMKLLKNFGLSIGFCVLFIITWAAHGITEWQTFTDDAREHKEPIEIGDFVAHFSRATLENWQSEFLQLFSFTIMASILIHKGSAESKDSGDRIEAALKRIEERLETEPASKAGGYKDLHVIPDEHQGWQLRAANATEPEGYYDTQDAAAGAGRQLAKENGVKLHIHSPDGEVRESTGGG